MSKKKKKKKETNWTAVSAIAALIGAIAALIVAIVTALAFITSGGLSKLFESKIVQLGTGIHPDMIEIGLAGVFLGINNHSTELWIMLLNN